MHSQHDPLLLYLHFPLYTLSLPSMLPYPHYNSLYSSCVPLISISVTGPLLSPSHLTSFPSFLFSHNFLLLSYHFVLQLTFMYYLASPLSPYFLTFLQTDIYHFSCFSPCSSFTTFISFPISTVCPSPSHSHGPVYATILDSLSLLSLHPSSCTLTICADASFPSFCLFLLKHSCISSITRHFFLLHHHASQYKSHFPQFFTRTLSRSLFSGVIQ